MRAVPDGPGWKCEVTVEHGGSRTRHTVRVSPDDVSRWAAANDREPVEDLVARSFAFLLEREPPTSILRSFDLSVIPRYFPEYEERFGQESRPG